MKITVVDLRSVERFVERLHEAETSAELAGVFHEAVNSLGYAHFDYHVMLSPAMDHGSSRMAFGLTSCPESHVQWSKALADLTSSRRRRQIMDDAGHAESHATTISLLSRHGECAGITLFRQTETSTLPTTTGLIQLIAEFFHVHALRQVLREEMLRQSKRRTSVLSVRERETMSWVASGKSSWEIAQILGIGQKSVDFYVESARRKLQASNRTHAVVKAVMLGLIDEPVTRIPASTRRLSIPVAHARLEDEYSLAN